jgi:sugar phosphate isomerase/epimerase
MNSQRVQFSVFTKPWRVPLAELGEMVHGWGFDGIELPVRPGYQVPPEQAATGLPKAAATLRECGLEIFSVAAPGGPLDEGLIAACGAAGVPVIRIMAPVEDDGYLASEARLQWEIQRILPWLGQYGVKVGVQNHSGRMVCNAGGLRALLAPFDARYAGAVWDAAHNALNGEEPEMALDLVWSHLCMVNLKNAFWRRANGPEAEVAEWRPWWTSGPLGLASWPRVAAELKRRAYAGVVCLTAEYSDESSVNRLVAKDLAFARALFE